MRKTCLMEFFMARPPRLIIVLVAALTAILSAVWLVPAGATSDEASLRALINEILDEREARTAPAMTQEQINPMIENYLMNNPKILQRVSDALQAVLQAEELEQARAGLKNLATEIYDDPDHVVLGNPDGDVTIVEFFDYNCVYCRRAMPDIAKLLDEDDNLRVILKEFPILSENSVDAARVSVVVAGIEGFDFWTFHEKLFTARGQISGETALAAAEEMGLSRVSLVLDMQDEAVTRVLQRSYAIAQELNITGTPAFIIGDAIIPGAVGYEVLRDVVANMRECGSSVCEQ